MNQYVVPLIIFSFLVVLCGIGLKYDPSHVPSPLIDKQIPGFSLPELKNPGSMVTADDLKGHVSLLNVWASWCIACRHEHDILVELSNRGGVRIYGLNYKDSREEALRWLEKHGDPYIISIFDQKGRVGIDFGVYGVPETYVLDHKGIIRYKHIGPITREILDSTILPLLKRLNDPLT